mmetsp:Transcript_83846/g.237801  ORF Transcript_83846/g.237801 Transcript_83846/m.237801 type:complete len:215 (+) Transcript_83846:1183-1827(+)
MHERAGRRGPRGGEGAWPPGRPRLLPAQRGGGRRRRRGEGPARGAAEPARPGRLEGRLERPVATVGRAGGAQAPARRGAAEAPDGPVLDVGRGLHRVVLPRPVLQGPPGHLEGRALQREPLPAQLARQPRAHAPILRAREDDRGTGDAAARRPRPRLRGRPRRHRVRVAPQGGGGRAWQVDCQHGDRRREVRGGARVREGPAGLREPRVRAGAR